MIEPEVRSRQANAHTDQQSGSTPDTGTTTTSTITSTSTSISTATNVSLISRSAKTLARRTGSGEDGGGGSAAGTQSTLRMPANVNTTSTSGNDLRQVRLSKGAKDRNNNCMSPVSIQLHRTTADGSAGDGGGKRKISYEKQSFVRSTEQSSMETGSDGRHGAANKSSCSRGRPRIGGSRRTPERAETTIREKTANQTKKSGEEEDEKDGEEGGEGEEVEAEEEPNGAEIGHLAPNTYTPQQPKSERKAAKTLSAILLAFIVTWTPYNVVALLRSLLAQDQNSDADVIPKPVIALKSLKSLLFRLLN